MDTKTVKPGRVYARRGDGGNSEEEASVPEGFGRPRGSSDVIP